MKPKNNSETKEEQSQSLEDKRLIGRREVIGKVGLYALSAATMMVIMKSQPAKASSARPEKPHPKGEDDKHWRRTHRN